MSVLRISALFVYQASPSTASLYRGLLLAGRPTRAAAWPIGGRLARQLLALTRQPRPGLPAAARHSPEIY